MSKKRGFMLSVIVFFLWTAFVNVITGEDGLRVNEKFSDDFSVDLLRNGSHYVEFYSPGFKVINNRLSAEVHPGDQALLDILPAFGRNASLSVDARWGGEHIPIPAIVIDGKGTDWSSVGIAAKDGREEDKLDADLKALRYVGDEANRVLYIRADYWGGFTPDKDQGVPSHLTVDFDLDRNGDRDYRVNLFFQLGSANAILTRGWASPQQWEPERWKAISVTGVKVAYGEEDGEGFVEAAIPWDLFEAVSGFELFVAAGSNRGPVDLLDLLPLALEMNHSLPRYPKTVWMPPPWGQKPK